MDENSRKQNRDAAQMLIDFHQQLMNNLISNRDHQEPHDWQAIGVVRDLDILEDTVTFRCRICGLTLERKVPFMSFEIHSTPDYFMNEWEKACREWLKGCSCAGTDSQEDCTQCTNAFHDHLRNLLTGD